MRIVRVSSVFIWLVPIAVLLGCASGGDNFKKGQDLSSKTRWEEAVLFYEAALKEEPNKEKYILALKRAKVEASKVRYAKATNMLASFPDPNIPTLNRILEELDMARKFNPENKKVLSAYKGLNVIRETQLIKVRRLYEGANKDLEKQQWQEAVNKLRTVNKLYPGYEATNTKLAHAEKEGAEYYYKKGFAYAKKEEWRLAVQNYESVIQINPEFNDIQALYKKAKANDNVQYFINKGQEASRAGDYDKGIFLISKAIEYEPSNEAIYKSLESMKWIAAHEYLGQAIEMASKDYLSDAVEKLKLGVTYAPSIKDAPDYKTSLSSLSQTLMERTRDYMEQEKWGNALVWLEKLELINPVYENIFYERRTIEDAIGTRIIRSIAVFDFSHPSNNEDAGKIIAKKLITFLYDKVNGDIKIIEREHLQPILEEYKLGQTGLIDTEKAKRAGKMKGIDIFIMGDVLHFSSKVEDFPSIKTAKIPIDSKRVKTHEFLEWEAKHPNPSREELETAPRAYEEKFVYKNLPYKAGKARILAFLEISYKMVDTLTSENIFTNTIVGKLIKEDTYNDGVPPEANIPFDPLDLPSELEVLGELTNKKLEELGSSILEQVQDLEVVYYNEAEQLFKRREYERAVEKYMDAIYDEKLKRISTPTAEKASERIQSLVKNM